MEYNDLHLLENFSEEKLRNVVYIDCTRQNKWQVGFIVGHGLNEEE